MEHSRILPAELANCAKHAVDTRNTLEELCRGLDRITAAAGEQRSADLPSEMQVRDILKARRARDKFFNRTLFADPAWDILLELYAAELGQRPLTVGSACIGAAVPASTALRWITALEREGLVTRQNDRFDARRLYVSLTPDGVAAMEAFFRALPSASII
jgi:DNA-binding MarR family transcriptional regulator